MATKPKTNRRSNSHGADEILYLDEGRRVEGEDGRTGILQKVEKRHGAYLCYEVEIDPGYLHPMLSEGHRAKYSHGEISLTAKRRKTRSPAWADRPEQIGRRWTQVQRMVEGKKSECAAYLRRTRKRLADDSQPWTKAAPVKKPARRTTLRMQEAYQSVGA